MTHDDTEDIKEETVKIETVLSVCDQAALEKPAGILGGRLELVWKNSENQYKPVSDLKGWGELGVWISVKEVQGWIGKLLGEATNLAAKARAEVDGGPDHNN